MGHKGETILPNCSSDGNLANTFSDFFKRGHTIIVDPINADYCFRNDAFMMEAEVNFEQLTLLTWVAVSHDYRTLFKVAQTFLLDM